MPYCRKFRNMLTFCRALAFPSRISSPPTMVISLSLCREKSFVIVWMLWVMLLSSSFVEGSLKHTKILHNSTTVHNSTTMPSLQQFLPEIYVLENVCLSGNDHILIPTGNLSQVMGKFDKRGRWSDDNGRGWTTPRSPQLLNDGVKIHRFITGNTLYLNCWRLSPQSTNPAHIQMAFGTLFANSYLELLPKLDLIVFHQCPSLEKSSLASFMLSLALKYVPIVRQSKIMHLYSTVQDIVCFDKLFVKPGTQGMYIDANVASDVDSFRKIITAEVQPSPIPESNKQILSNSSESEQLDVTNCSKSCTSELVIGIWNRTEGTALRSIVNLHQVARMAQMYTRKPVMRYSASSHTSVPNQIAVFRDFDILLTTHGSQLANMLFSPENSVSVFVEILIAQIEPIFCANAKQLARGYVESWGHDSETNTEQIREQRRLCFSNSSSVCPRQSFKKMNIVANITRLQLDLERAIRMRCNCSTEVVSCEFHYNLGGTLPCKDGEIRCREHL